MEILHLVHCQRSGGVWCVWKHHTSFIGRPTGKLYRNYCQRNRRTAITKQTTVHAAKTPSSTLLAANPEPSVMTDRSASFSAVSGRARISGNEKSGKRE